MSIFILPIAIPNSAHGRRNLFRQMLFFLGGMLTAFALKMPASAEESRTLIFPPNDGYGFEECLKEGSPCGLVVADALCKAHGFGGSKAFGPAEEATGTVDEALRSSIEPGSFHVTCGARVN